MAQNTQETWMKFNPWRGGHNQENSPGISKNLKSNDSGTPLPPSLETLGSIQNQNCGDMELHLWKDWVTARNTAQEGHGKESPPWLSSPPFITIGASQRKPAGKGLWVMESTGAGLPRLTVSEKMENGPEGKPKQKTT